MTTETGGPTALIVDDELVSRLVLRHMLERQGVAVVETDSADQAAEYLALHAVDLIVCDYVMPDKTGLDLISMLPADHAPFVLLTGELRKDDLDDERVAEVNAYLTKPVASDELRAVVEAALVGSGAVAPTTSTPTF